MHELSSENINLFYSDYLSTPIFGFNTIWGNISLRSGRKLLCSEGWTERARAERAYIFQSKEVVFRGELGFIENSYILTFDIFMAI